MSRSRVIGVRGGLCIDSVAALQNFDVEYLASTVKSSQLCRNSAQPTGLA